jgi:hypothetical protein
VSHLAGNARVAAYMGRIHRGGRCLSPALPARSLSSYQAFIFDQKVGSLPCSCPDSFFLSGVVFRSSLQWKACV